MKIKIDGEKFTEAGLVFRQDGPVMCFMVPGRTDIVRAKIQGDDMVLMPERSSAHKALLKALEPGS